MSFLLGPLVAVIGLLIYFASNNPKVVEVGRIAYFVGLLVTLLQAGPKVVSFFGG